MLQLAKASLPQKTRAGLRGLQQRIDALPNYEARVNYARVLFPQQNRPDNPIFKSVRKTLSQMCSGARRCSYCEDSSADEVEHIKPKDLFPESTFAWSNYLYACGPCNGPKKNRFGILLYGTSKFVDVTRKPGQPITPPKRGRPASINPRRENALEFMELDLIDTFYFLPSAPLGSPAYKRAQYTIAILRLNERDLLPAARREAYLSYRARLVEYIAKRDSGASRRKLDALSKALQRMAHPTVWVEMKRQQGRIRELNGLFAKAPEALNW
jgi:5-methylcytosine-specific restriction endonuclease McrA